MRWNRDDWARRAAAGFDALRVEFGVYTQHLERAIGEGLRTGDAVPGTGGLVTHRAATRSSPTARSTPAPRGASTRTRDSGPTSTPAGLATVPFDELVPLMRRATDAGLTPAVHAIGDRANARVLDAFEAVGCRGSIEHAQLLRHEDVARFASLGIVASVQPEHAMDDRDVADRYWAGRTDRAFMLAELAAAGVELALGSDAPVAPLDPWVAIAAAVGRTRDGREPWHPEQAIEAGAALAASTGGRGAQVRVGSPPISRWSNSIRSRHPSTNCAGCPSTATLLAGRFTHGSR